MHSYLVLTESGPILTVTSSKSAATGVLPKVLTRRGIRKFIAHEVPVEYVHRLYGVPFEVIAGDIKDGVDVRVLDFDGDNIFRRVSLSMLGDPQAVEH